MSSRKLTNIKSDVKGRGIQLTKQNKRKFVLCFEDKLQRGYTFEQLEKRDIKTFQKFLDIVSQLDFSEVDKRYLRQTDKNDKYQGQQVIHYELSENFRIHGIVVRDYFMIIRLDPNHKVHK